MYKLACLRINLKISRLHISSKKLNLLNMTNSLHYEGMSSHACPSNSIRKVEYFGQVIVCIVILTTESSCIDQKQPMNIGFSNLLLFDFLTHLQLGSERIRAEELSPPSFSIISCKFYVDLPSYKR